MEGNKDEAERCVRIAESAIKSRDKQKALKFIKIARRLNPNVSVDALTASCEALGGESVSKETASNRVVREPSRASNGHRIYTDEHVKSIREIRRHKDYYAILGVEKGCSVDEVRKAYRKLSLKVHPDKNTAPGSEEAFKIVSRAFKCLSNEQSRRKYDQTGFADDLELIQHNHDMRRRRTTTNEFFDDGFDPDEIFRSFFYGSPAATYRTEHVYTRREAPRRHRNGDEEGGFNLSYLLHFLPVLFFFLVACMPFSEPSFVLKRTQGYQVPMVTAKYGVEYYVKSDFEQKFPKGSISRANLELSIVREHKGVLSHYCRVEMHRRQWAKNYPTPHCDKLQSFGVAQA